MAPALILSGNVLGRTVALAALFPALAAVLITATGDSPEPEPGRRAKRLLLAGGVVAVLGGAALAGTGLDNLAYAAFVAGVPVTLTAWVLSDAYSPSPAVRALVQPLTSLDASRPACLMAILAWPVAMALSVLLCSRLPGMSVTPPGRPALELFAVWLVPDIFTAALGAIAWYGFAARRLESRLPPLVAALLVGAAQWLITWATAMGLDGVGDPFFLSRLAGSVAVAVVTVWVLARSRGSLLPVWVMSTLLLTSQLLLFLVVSADDVARADTPHQVFALAQVFLAAVLVVTGRMWRRPAPQ